MCSALQRLDQRIVELHQECDDALINLKELHRERGRLKREKETKEEEIKQLEAKCIELQMLKFGRIVQLDDLEAGADRSKEMEAEEEIRALDRAHRMEYNKLMKEVEAIQEELAQVSYHLHVLRDKALLTCFSIAIGNH
jgi:DNA repair ATPase RecN